MDLPLIIGIRPLGLCEKEFCCCEGFYFGFDLQINKYAFAQTGMRLVWRVFMAGGDDD
jgi:hypothetical protein